MNSFFGDSSNWIQCCVAILPSNVPVLPKGPLQRHIAGRSPVTIGLLSPCSATYLHYLFDDGLVRADLGALQSADALANPGDEGELSTFAHGISRCDPDKSKETTVILGERREMFCQSD